MGYIIIPPPESEKWYHYPDRRPDPRLEMMQKRNAMLPVVVAVNIVILGVFVFFLWATELFQ